jgi:hypothetical protein
MGIMEDMMAEIQNASSGKGLVFEVKKDNQAKVRFLVEGNNNIKLPIHGRFSKVDPSLNYSVICLKAMGASDCPLCEMAEDESTLRNTRVNYCSLIYDYRDSKVKAFVYKASKATPWASLTEMHSNYGTLVNRDYIIKRTGTGFEQTYPVTPMDKSDFAYLNDAVNQVKEIMGKGVVVEFSDKPFVGKVIKQMVGKSWCASVLKTPPVVPPNALKDVRDPSDSEDDEDDVNSLLP